MAQKANATRGLRLLARRFGMGSKGPLLAALVLVVAVGVVGVGRLSAQEGFVIERADGVGGTEGAADVPTAEVPSGEEPTAPEAAHVVVHVDGAVQVPGVYELAGAGPRVNDAVLSAGGLAPDADTTAVNLASPVADGQKVHIPRVGEVAEQAHVAPAATDVTATTAPVDQGAGLVNINTASAAELTALPGVGEATAAAIVGDRDANGPFASPEDLMRVSGIGEKKFAKMQGLVCV